MAVNGNSFHNRAEDVERSSEDDNQGRTRQEMESFWKEHSRMATEEEMMLDSNAEELGKEEIPEILSLLPSVTGMNVLELGAGIGRFTGHLANKARSLMAVDFMEAFIEKNRELNDHHGNIIFRQADVTQLDLPQESFDVVFSNWLLMYLEENEVRVLFAKILKWLRPGGYFFFRESCFHQSGDAKRQYNPTKYRDPATYNNILEGTALMADDALKTYAFEMILSKPIQTYIKLKNNCNQICWLMHKADHQEKKFPRNYAGSDWIQRSSCSQENGPNDGDSQQRNGTHGEDEKRMHGGDILSTSTPASLKV